MGHDGCRGPANYYLPSLSTRVDDRAQGEHNVQRVCSSVPHPEPRYRTPFPAGKGFPSVAILGT
jgi:hypothetical protein